jgi:hypothetical protein
MLSAKGGLHPFNRAPNRPSDNEHRSARAHIWKRMNELTFIALMIVLIEISPAPTAVRNATRRA